MVSPFSAWTAFGPRFRTLLGSFWEDIWPPINSKPVSSVASGRPRAVSNYFLGGPKASKSAPRGIQERSIRPWKPSSGISSLSKSSKRPPRRRQETSRAHLATILVPCWINFEAISMRCCHHVGHVSSLKAPSPRALDPRSQARRNARSD